LERTIEQEYTSGCNVAILFMTDGERTTGPETDEVLGLINDSTQRLATLYGRDTKIFTFSLGAQADHLVTKEIACSTNGIWTPVDDFDGDLVGAMASYYKLYALGLGDDTEFTAWVEPYESFSGECCEMSLLDHSHRISISQNYFCMPYTQLRRWALRTVHPSLIDLLILPYS
jgi:hypothetical protein